MKPAAPASLEAEEALLRSQQRFELVLEATSEGLWEWDIESNHVTWSERTLAMLGYDRSTFGGTFAFIEQILHDNDRESFARALRAHVEQGAPYDLDLRLRRADGTFGTFHARGKLLRDAGGRPLRMAGSMADVTELRRQERLLERAESVAQIGGWEFDPAVDRVYFSAETYRLHRLEPSQGAPTLDAMLACYADESRELLGEAIRRGLAQALSWDLELSLLGAPRREVRVTGRAEVEAGRTVVLFGTVQDITTRKQAEDALRRSEQRFRGYFEFSAVGLAISTLEKGLIEVNNRFCEQLGYTRDEVMKMTWAELTHPDDLASDVREFERVLAGEIDTYTIAKRFLRKGGEIVHTEVSVRGVRKSDGSVDYFLGLLNDVSERVQAEHALRESVELSTKAFRAIPDPVSVTDVESGRFLDVNEGFERLCGLSRAELIGKTSRDLAFWERPEDRDELVRRVRRDGSVRDFATIARTPTGELKSCLISAESVEIGGRSRLIVVARDITEQQRAERALRESEQKFLAAFQAGPNAIAISDLESGHLLEFNESFERLVGLSRAELLGNSSVALGVWSDDDRAQFIDVLFGKGAVRGMELRSTNLKGEQLVMLVSADITQLNGRNCVILVAHDITERRRAEEAKARLEDELRQMQRLEAMGTLAGGVAHDFNNILGAIVAYVDLARMDAQGNDSVMESLNEVLKGCDRAKQLVRQILAFSRRQPQERHSIRLQPVVKEVLRLVRSTLPATIEISAQVKAETGRVYADTTQIHQVLVNLCTNSAYAMRDSAGRLSLELSELDVSEEVALQNPSLHAGRYARLSVCDTGHGMDPETVQRMFEPFFTTKKPGEGTGLGLSVVHGIVSDHGGVIQVDSQPGQGSKVHVLLPVRGADARDEEDQVHAPLPGQQERILFIDDEPALCATAQKLLERLNYRVHTETSALAALALFRRDPAAFDLVVTDLTMPLMTGVDVATEVLRIRPGLPVLVATGFNAAWSRETVRALGVRDLVLKPLSVTALANSIRDALSPGPA